MSLNCGLFLGSSPPPCPAAFHAWGRAIPGWASDAESRLITTGFTRGLPRFVVHSKRDPRQIVLFSLHPAPPSRSFSRWSRLTSEVRICTRRKREIIVRRNTAVFICPVRPPGIFRLAARRPCTASALIKQAADTKRVIGHCCTPSQTSTLPRR